MVSHPDRKINGLFLLSADEKSVLQASFWHGEDGALITFEYPSPENTAPNWNKRERRQLLLSWLFKHPLTVQTTALFHYTWNVIVMVFWVFLLHKLGRRKEIHQTQEIIWCLNVLFAPRHQFPGPKKKKNSSWGCQSDSAVFPKGKRSLSYLWFSKRPVAHWFHCKHSWKPFLDGRREGFHLLKKKIRRIHQLETQPSLLTVGLCWALET